MLEIFRKLKAGPVSAQALREARAALDLHVADKTVQKREAARREAILTGEPKAIATAESALHDARLEAERAQIAVQELEKRIAEADRREADEAVSARIAEIEKRRDAVRRRISKDLAPALKTACEVLTEIAEVDAEISAENLRLDAAGRRERIAATEEGTTPIPENQYAPIWHLAASTVIRPVKAWGIVGYGWDKSNADA